MDAHHGAHRLRLAGLVDDVHVAHGDRAQVLARRVAVGDDELAALAALRAG
jgi:hypothetical protein